MVSVIWQSVMDKFNLENIKQNMSIKSDTSESEPYGFWRPRSFVEMFVLINIAITYVTYLGCQFNKFIKLTYW